MLSWVLYQSEKFPNHAETVGERMIPFSHFTLWNVLIAVVGSVPIVFARSAASIMAAKFYPLQKRNYWK